MRPNYCAHCGSELRAEPCCGERERRQGTYPNEQALKLAINVLNQALLDDRVAINALMSQSVSANNDLSSHWSVQVGIVESSATPLMLVLRPLGLINGLFGIDDHDRGFITMRIDNRTGDIVQFERTVRHE